MSFGKFKAVEAEVEICYNKRINNETVSPFCGKTLGAKGRTVTCNDLQCACPERLSAVANVDH